MGGGILLGEGDGDRRLVAFLDADELLLEAGNELVGAEHEVGILGCTALEGFAVDLAEVIEGDAVAVRGLALLRLVAARRIGNALDLLGHFLFWNVIDETADLERRKVLLLDRRQNLVIERKLEIGIAGQDLLGFLLVLGHGDLGLHGRLFAALVEDRPGRIRQDLVDDFGHEGLAVHLAQVLHGHLAGPEAVDPDLVLRRGEPLHEPCFHVLGGHGHLDLALQPIVERFGYLHLKTFVFIDAAGAAYCRPDRCKLLAGEWLWCG